MTFTSHVTRLVHGPESLAADLTVANEFYLDGISLGNEMHCLQVVSLQFTTEGTYRGVVVDDADVIQTSTQVRILNIKFFKLEITKKPKHIT